MKLTVAIFGLGGDCVLTSGNATVVRFPIRQKRMRVAWGGAAKRDAIDL